jgi:hypothetical protein
VPQFFSQRVRRALRLLRSVVCVVLVLSIAVSVTLKVQRFRELFYPWLTIYVKEPGHEETGHYYLYDPTLGWRNVPNWTATTHGYRLSINSRGLRDREHSYKKPPGVRRVLVLGDSFAWGYGVGDRNIFPEVLERRFESSGRNWQVINTGVSGWGTDQQYLFLKSEGFRYEPDVVVLAFYLINDPREVTVSDVYGLSKPVFLDTNLTLGNVPVPLPSRPKSGLESKVEKLELVITLMVAIERECRQRNCRLVVMKFGMFADPTDGAMSEVEELFESKLSDLRDRVGYLDLDAEFRSRKLRPGLLLVGNDDGHWNDFGHAQVGQILGEFLDEFLDRYGWLGRSEQKDTGRLADDGRFLETGS